MSKFHINKHGVQAFVKQQKGTAHIVGQVEQKTILHYPKK